MPSVGMAQTWQPASTSGSSKTSTSSVSRRVEARRGKPARAMPCAKPMKTFGVRDSSTDARSAPQPLHVASV